MSDWFPIMVNLHIPTLNLELYVVTPLSFRVGIEWFSIMGNHSSKPSVVPHYGEPSYPYPISRAINSDLMYRNQPINPIRDGVVPHNGEPSLLTLSGSPFW